MAKVTLNPMFEAIQGDFGDLIFREIRGKTIVSRKPILNGELSESQVAHRDRFKRAAIYGKSVMSDAAARAIYEAAAMVKDIPIFALTVKDFMNPPSILSIDASGYVGQAGGTIMVVATDDFDVASVELAITNADEGTPVERGQAVETSTGYWIYTATSNATPGILAGIQVIVKDRPGNRVSQQGTKQI